MTSISYCEDVLFECGWTRGLQGTCVNANKHSHFNFNSKHWHDEKPWDLMGKQSHMMPVGTKSSAKRWDMTYPTIVKGCRWSIIQPHLWMTIPQCTHYYPSSKPILLIRVHTAMGKDVIGCPWFFHAKYLQWPVQLLSPIGLKLGSIATMHRSRQVTSSPKESCEAKWCRTCQETLQFESKGCVTQKQG